MSKFDNGLSDAQLERLVILMEESAEVIQIVCKTIRHGLDSINPYEPERGTNRDKLQEEMGHVLVASNLLVQAEDINLDLIEGAYVEKSQNISKWLHHNKLVGDDPWTSELKEI